MVPAGFNKGQSRNVKNWDKLGQCGPSLCPGCDLELAIIDLPRLEVE